MKKIIVGRVACNVTLILYHKGYVEGTYVRHGQPVTFLPHGTGLAGNAEL